MFLYFYLIIILLLQYLLRRKNIKISFNNIIIEYTHNVFSYYTMFYILIWPISITLFFMRIINKFGLDFYWILEIIMMIDNENSLIII